MAAPSNQPTERVPLTKNHRQLLISIIFIQLARLPPPEWTSTHQLVQPTGQENSFVLAG